MRRSRLTETSLIVHWIAPGLGRFKTVAKGALRPRNPFGGVLDLFHQCELQFQRSRSGELHALREATLLESFPRVRTSLVSVGLAAYGVELIERTTEKETPVPELYDLLERALRYLNGQAPSLKALHHFESELVRLLGISEPDTPAAASLNRLLHGLPPSRDRLLHQLGAA